MNYKDWFIPNKIISKDNSQIIIGIWVAFVSVAWFFSPFPFLPKPMEVYSSFMDLWIYDNLGLELFTSFKLNLETILFSTLVSLGLAYLSTIGLFKPIIGVLGKLRFLSMVGLSFFFTLVSTSGHELKLYMLVFSVSVFFITGMADVIAGIPSEQYDLAKTLRLNDWETLYEVVILGQIDKAFEVMRQNAAIGFMMLTMVEGMARSDGGIGDLLLDQNKHFHISAVFAIQLTILFIGLLQDYCIGALRIICCPWANLNRRN